MTYNIAIHKCMNIHGSPTKEMIKLFKQRINKSILRYVIQTGCQWTVHPK